MKLYKYRGITRIERALDIIINERLYCPAYRDMNDPFEGLFASTLYLGPQDKLKLARFGAVPPDKLPVHYSVDNLLDETEKVRVCSLSKSRCDVRMWSHYAEAHSGIAIEIDFSEVKDEVLKVDYEQSLPHFEYSLLTGMPKPSEVLTHKTDHWDYEEEYRIITDSEFYSVHGRISSIYCGVRMKDDVCNLLCKLIPKDIPVFRTSLNQHSVKIYPQKKPIERN